MATDTRWCSKFNVVSAVKENLVSIISVLNEIGNDYSSGDALCLSKSLCKSLNSYKFVSLLNVWYLILE